MKRNLIGKQLVALLSLFLTMSLWGCREDLHNNNEINQTTKVTFVYNNLPTDIKIKTLKTTVNNITTGEIKTISSVDETIALTIGLYKVETVIETYLNDPEITSVYYGKADNIQIDKSEEIQKISIDLEKPAIKGGLVIREIFLTGTKTKNGKSFSRDQYIVLYNNSNETIYADRVAILESQLISTKEFVYDPDIRNEAMTPQAVYVIPGSGKDHPVAPGQSLVIAEMAQNHTLQNDWSFDLLHADFEWYDENDKYPDIDNPNVPNLERWYCYTMSIWMLHNRGFCAYAIARIPSEISKEDFLKNYEYDYIWKIAGKEIEKKAYKIPNEWILDGVNVTTPVDRVWDILPPSIDLGWTYVSEKDGDETRFFKSFRRKVDYVTPNGTAILVDTNNSTNDFNPRVTPSVIEEQGTVKDSDGSKADTKTYDGVVSIKQ